MLPSPWSGDVAMALWVCVALAAGAARAQGIDAPTKAKALEALADESFKVRLQAVILLGRSGDAEAGQALLNLVATDPHYTVRAAAATALANLQLESAIAHIVRQVAVDPDPFVREHARKALLKFPRDKALPYVEAAYGFEDARVREEVVRYVTSDGPTSHAVLIKGLGDTQEIFELVRAAVLKMPRDAALEFLDAAASHRNNPAVRRGAVHILKGMPSKEATELVLQVYERDIEIDEVRAAARDAIRELREFLPIKEIVERAKADGKHARARALKLLGVIGGDLARATLLEGLRDTDMFQRGTAVMALADLGDASVARDLEAMLDDPANKRIAHLIRHTLKQLTHKDKDT